MYEGATEDVVGVLRVMDYLCRAETRPVGEYARPAMFLDAGLNVDDAFRRLQEAGQTMAIVRDAGGRAVGMVTVDDLLQDILRGMAA